MPDTNYPNPLLDQVVFEVKFPNLFYLENKIGDFQTKIIEKFPQSSLLYRQQIVFTDIGSSIKEEVDKNKLDKNFKKKIWQFRSDTSEINITTDSIDISSNKIKLYSDQQDGFKKVIEYVMSNFLEVMTIPQFNRIGLRFINICPLEQKTNTYFNSMFKTVFPTSRFKLEESQEMVFSVLNKADNLNLIFKEIFQEIDNSPKLILDLDCYTEAIKSDTYLTVTDSLHNRIKTEFFNSIKEPVKVLMRGTPN